MDDIEILEEIRGYVCRKKLGPPALGRRLLRFWPRSTGEESSNMSALDCLIMVTRHIYCHVAPMGALDETIDANEL